MEIQGLPGRLLAELGPAIASGEIPEGAVLRSEELEERFGVSRTVVREAVRILEGMRLVASRRRVGITVQPKSDWDVFDPLVIRWRLAGSDRRRSCVRSAHCGSRWSRPRLPWPHSTPATTTGADSAHWRLS